MSVFVYIYYLQIHGLIFRAIQLSNCFHKTAVLASIACFSSYLMRVRALESLIIPFGVLGGSCACLYWFTQGDPLTQYQVDESGEDIRSIPSNLLLTNASYVILVRKDTAVRKILHNILSFGAVALSCRYYLSNANRTLLWYSFPK